MEHEKLASGHSILFFSHGILSILPPNCTKCVCFLPPLNNRHLCRKSAFSAKCRECKIEKRDSLVILRNGHGKVMDKYFVKSVGTLL